MGLKLLKEQENIINFTCLSTSKPINKKNTVLALKERINQLFRLQLIKTKSNELNEIY